MAPITVKTKLKPRGRPFEPGNQTAVGNRGRPPMGDLSTTTSIKKAFLLVFDKLGGADGFFEWVTQSPKNKTAFYGWITKLLPRIIDLEDGAEDALERTLSKYKDLSAHDLEEKAAGLAEEVSRTCGIKVRIRKAQSTKPA